jgi:hypothetical protein
MGGAGIVGLFAVLNGRASLALAAGVGGVLLAIVNLSTLDASKVSAMIGGQNFTAEFAPHVSPAWGSWVVLIASGLLTVFAFAAMRSGANPHEPEDVTA